MKTLVSVLFFLSLSFQTLGQTPYLSEKYLRSRNIGNSLAIGDNSYFIGGNLNVNTELYQYSKINLQGQIVDTLNISYQDSAYTIDNCKGCLHVHMGTLYNAYSNFPNYRTNDSAVIILSKVHLDLSDTIKSKVITIAGYKGLATEASFFDSDSTFLITGYAFRDVGPTLQYKYDLLLAKFDTNFNLIWQTTVADNSPINFPFGPVGGSIIVDNHGGILVSGNPFFEPLPKRGFAARFDASTGASLWYKEFTGDYGIGGMYCANRDDGNYQFIQNWYTKANSFFIRFNIGILDTMGNIINQKLIGENKRYQFGFGLIQTLDGNYYSAGTGRYGNPYGIGLKFSPQLDSLWQGYYWHDDPWEYSWIGSFQQKPDSNFIHLGLHIDHINSSPMRLYSWLFETNQNGCDTSGCNLSSEEYTSEKPLELSVFPNPTQGVFHVQFQNPKNQGYYHLEIWDMLGRKVKQESFWLESDFVEVQTNLPKGFYNLLILKDNLLIGQEKLVLE